MTDTMMEQQPQMGDYPEHVQRLLARAMQGDLTVLAALRALLDGTPELWQRVGDLAQHAEVSMLRLAAGTSLLGLEAMQRKLADLKRELAGPSPSVIERLLIDRIGVCWLQVHHADMEVAEGLGRTLTPQGVYAQRRLDSAHKRYLHAIRQLAVVRNLLRPAEDADGAAPRATRRGRDKRRVRNETGAAAPRSGAPRAQ